jgi:hypothetical protein
MILTFKRNLLGDRAELVVRVGETISNHERLEVDLGYGWYWGKVKCRVVLVDRLFVSDVPWTDVRWRCWGYMFQHKIHQRYGNLLSGIYQTIRQLLSDQRTAELA